MVLTWLISSATSKSAIACYMRTDKPMHEYVCFNDYSTVNSFMCL